MFRKVIPVILILAVFTTACGMRVKLPIALTSGPTTTDQINIPLPDDTTEAVHLSLAFGAGTLTLAPGSDALISGTATYNVADFKPEVTVSGHNVRIEQGEYTLKGIPDMSNIVNEWDLSIGNVPIDLSIKAGAYEAEYEFGGLSLTNLTIQDGAADVELAFSSPNYVGMTFFRYETGVSNVSLTGLANANFTTMEFDSGAGNYTLDFSGELKRDASVNIETGVSNLTLIIPEGIPVQVTVESGLSNVSVGSGWTKNGKVYAQSGSGPVLTIVIEIGAGNLTLSH